jgi:hypothetical protein
MEVRSKILLISAALLLIASPVYSDSLDDLMDVQSMWDGQKSITNKEFEEVVDALQANQKKKEEKVKKRKIKKISGGGNSLHTDLGIDKNVLKMSEISIIKNENLINIYVPVRLEDCILEEGFYKIIAQKDENNKLFFNFYQSDFYKGRVEAYETDNDFGENELNFVKILPHNDNYMKLIYGSIEYNAYTYLPYEWGGA